MTGRTPGEEETTMTDTIRALLAPHPDAAPAFGAPGRDWLTYGGLRALAGTVAATLQAAGVGRGDRRRKRSPGGIVRGRRPG